MRTGIDGLAIVVPILSGIRLMTSIWHSSAWAVAIVVVTAAIIALIVVAADVGVAGVRET
jgi:hypothetical protein